MTSHEEIIFLIKMTNYITEQNRIKISCVNPRIHTMNGNFSAYIPGMR